MQILRSEIDVFVSSGEGASPLLKVKQINVAEGGRVQRLLERSDRPVIRAGQT